MAETFTSIHQLSKWTQRQRFPIISADKLNANWDKIDANLVKAATAFPSTFPLNKLLMRTLLDLQAGRTSLDWSFHPPQGG